MKRDAKIIDDYEEILEIIAEFFEDDNRAETWMASRNQLLGGVSPATLIVQGRTEELRKFVYNASEENRREPSAA